MKERWKPCPGFHAYEISSHGRVRRAIDGRLRILQIDRGYIKVSLWEEGHGYNRYVHRLVCAAFNGLPPKPGMDAAHLDGDRGNNYFKNLQWKTRKENEADKIPHRRDNSGERNGMAKLTWDTVCNLRVLLETLPRSSGGKKFRKGALKQLAKDAGVSTATLYQISAGLLWKRLP